VESVLEETSTDPSILAGLRDFLAAEVKSRHERHAEVLDDQRAVYDERGCYSDAVLELKREVRTASAQAGYYMMLAPESLGGTALGHVALYEVWETIFRTCGTRYWLGWDTVAHWTKGPSPLLEHLAPRLRERFLSGLTSGTWTTCFAMSEPDAGSDAWMMRTRAVAVDGGWQLDGEKQWISGAANAHLAIVFAVTDPEEAAARRGGITAFVVPADTPGFGVYSVTPMFGRVGSNEGIIQLAGVRIPSDHVLGDVGDGFRLALSGVSLGRLYNAAKAVGLARWALAQALDYVQERRAFGEPIAAFQGITFPLAEAAMEMHAAHLVGHNCAELLDAGRPARMELAMAKTFATEAGARAIDRAIQAHGAMGFTNELGLAEAWQQLRQVWVADGSSEILRRTIVRELLKGGSAAL
jgi:alkylation response protein AidB-like acyl-CoA dehydrogenase